MPTSTKTKIQLKCSGVACSTALEVEMTVSPDGVHFAMLGEDRGTSTIPAHHSLGCDDSGSFCETTITVHCHRCVLRGF